MYNFNYNVQYTTNKDYRNCLRNVFGMDITGRIEGLMREYGDLWQQFDDETKDELIFDHKKTAEGIQYLLKITEKESKFRELYLKAAALMLSEDIDTGMVVLLSYDYFIDFHQCLVSFCKTEDLRMNETTLYWIGQLMKRMTK